MNDDNQPYRLRPIHFFKKLRRRRVFNTLAIYIVGAWVVLQAADLAFPGLEIPESAIRYVWIGTILLVPLVLILARGGTRVRFLPRRKTSRVQLHPANIWV